MSGARNLADPSDDEDFTVASVRPSASKPDRGIVNFDVKVVNQRGETVQEGEWVVMFHRR